MNYVKQFAIILVCAAVFSMPQLVEAQISIDGASAYGATGRGFNKITIYGSAPGSNGGTALITLKEVDPTGGGMIDHGTRRERIIVEDAGAIHWTSTFKKNGGEYMVGRVFLVEAKIDGTNHTDQKVYVLGRNGSLTPPGANNGPGN